MAAKSIVERLLEQREGWVELDEPNRRAVRIRRPAEREIMQIAGKSVFETSAENVHGWRNFRESDLLGEAIGSSDAVPFDRELWATLSADNLDWCAKIHEAVIAMVDEHLKHRAAISGN